MNRWGRWLASMRRIWWVWPLAWLLLAGVAMKSLPSLTQVASSQSQSFLPNSSEPSVAQHYLNRIGAKSGAGGQSVLVVMHSQRRLTAHDKALFAARLKTLSVGRRVGPAPSAGTSPFLAPNDRTDFALITLKPHAPLTPTASRITKAVANLGPGLQTAVTGSGVIGNAVSQTDLGGLNRMLVVTLIVVVAIMLFVFRSPIAPLVSMFTIGTAFLITKGVVAWLGQHGMAVSTYTQTFLIAIMFGAGTDYSILIIARFREELSRTEDVGTALAATVGAVGPTALVAAATLVLAFLAVDLARFSLYRSGVGVAVGVAIIAVGLLTVVPGLLLGLGRFLFWPLRPVVGAHQGGGGTWAKLADIVVRRPAWAIVPAVALLVLAYLGSGPLSFNEIQQLPQNQPSVAAFTWIEQGFGGGEVLPMNVVLKEPPSGPSFRSVRGVEALSHASSVVAAENGVKAVEGPTSPLGTPLTAIEISTEAKSAAAGVQTMTAALNAIASGLQTGARQGSTFVAGLPTLSSGLGRLDVASEALTSGLQSSQSGALALNQASLSLYQGLQTYGAAIEKVSQSATTLAGAASSIHQGQSAASAGAGALATGASGVVSGLNSLEGGAAQLNQGLVQATAQLAKLTAAAESLSQQDPALAGNSSYQALVAGLKAESSALTTLGTAAGTLDQGLETTAAGGATVSQQLSTLASSLMQLTTATNQLSQGLSGLSGALSQLATQEGQLTDGAGAIQSGLSSLASGTAKLAGGAGQLAAGLGQAQAGVSSASTDQASQLVAGLDKASQGTHAVAVHLGQLGTLLLKPLAQQKGGGTVVSPSLLTSKEFQPVLNAFVSPGGHVATLTVVLAENPYTAQAMSRIGPVTNGVRQALKGTPFHAASIYIGGSTSQSQALNNLSSHDFGQTAGLVLLVIGIMLLILLRSLLVPILLLGLVSLNYFATTHLAALVATGPMHQSGLSWTSPFFSFLLLVALGVDYIIFYMARFREEERHGVREALVRTARLAAPVVFSAALIMGGTFGSMTASGATDLVEIGLTVVIGLALDMVLIMGFTAPAVLRVLGPWIHWPFGGPAVASPGA